MKVQHTATLDFTDNGVFETGWRIKQGDYGNTELVLRLVNNGVNVYDAGITPQIAFRRWDGASVISVMTPNDQTYKYAFAGNELEVPGLTLCDVKFTDSEGRVSTASCRFTVVEDTVGYDPTGAHTYDNPVSVLVEQATNAAEVGIESSFKAEGFAVGEQGGVPVEEGSPYYHNNAKYYAQQAGDPIGTAVQEQTTTTGRFTTKTGGKLESCIVAFNPVQSGSGDPSPSNVRPITGHSQVEVTNVGKNRFNSKLTNNIGTYACSVSESNGNITVVASGADCYYGTFESVGATYTTRMGTKQKCIPGESLKFICSDSRFNKNFVTFFNENNVCVANERVDFNAFTVPSGASYFVCRIGYGGSVSGVTYNFTMMIISSSETDTTYEPYQGQDVIVYLGGTRYGGTLDVVSGVLTVTHGFVELNGSETWSQGSGQYTNVMYTAIGYEKTGSTPISNYMKGVQSTHYSSLAIGEFAHSNSMEYRDYNFATSFTSIDEWKANLASNPLQVVYTLATPITIQLTPQQINTLIGENNIDVPLTGQSLTSAVYRELFAWDDVEDVVELRLPISAIGTDESNNDKASQAYSQGDYFYKNGIAKAKTSIASGATFTLGTNYEIKTLAEILKALES